MKFKMLQALSYLAIGFAFHANGFAADTNPPPRLTVELRDGSRVVGESEGNTFKLRSDLLGEIKLPVKDVRVLDFTTTNFAKLVTVNGDSLKVSLVNSDIPVKTGFGKVELKASSIRKLTVSVVPVPGSYPSGLVALWSGEGNGKDSVGNDDADLRNVTFAAGEMGQAFSFNGVDSTIRIPASRATDLSADDGFTIMAWIKPSSVSGLHPLFWWAVEMSVWINIRPSDNGALMACITEGTGNRFLVSDPGVLTADVFQHIALTYDKASGIAKWYLNGVVVARRKLSGPVPGTQGDLWLSHRDDQPGNWSTGRMYAGLMDEIAIYNRALSAEEIQSICADQSHGEPLTKPDPSDGWHEEWMR